MWNGEAVVRTAEGMVDGSVSLLRLCRLLVQAGIDPPQIAALLAERDETLGWRKYSDRQYASTQYWRIVHAVLRGTPLHRQGNRR